MQGLGKKFSILQRTKQEAFSLPTFKDTHKENGTSNKIKALTKSMSISLGGWYIKSTIFKAFLY